VPDTEAPDIEVLYREHRAGLVRLVERELHDRHDAEDVVQTAFLDAQRALQRGTIPHNPRAWLAAIALNAARRVRRRHVNVEALEEYAVQQASRLPEIRAALADLPKNEQAAVLYRDVFGLSYAEMAEQMGRTVPAVTMILHRARSHLRGLLGIALVGGGISRWLRSNEWEASAANAAGVVVLAGGLATAGVVASGHVARASAPAHRVPTFAAAHPRHELAGPRTSSGVVRTHSSSAVRRSSTARTPSDASPTAGAPPLGDQAPPTPRSPSRPHVRSKATAPVASLADAVLPPLSLPSLPAPVPQPPSLPAPASTVPALATATVATPIATVTVSVP
jgi:RNA polymerase sigma-70 factor (ECF subfamily)